MRETFPHKNKGDALGAGHVNALSDVARRTAAAMQGGYLLGHDGQPIGSAPWHQRVVIVTGLECDGDENLYEVRHRYYDIVSEAWTTDDTTNDSYCMDATALNLTFDVDDLIVVYWDAQREAYIPIAELLSAGDIDPPPDNGTGAGCDCGDCPEGINLPGNPTECCRGHIFFTSDNPDGGELIWKYSPDDQWATDEFDGVRCATDATDQATCEFEGGVWADNYCTTANVYQYVLQPDVDGVSIIEKVLVTDNGCEIECVRYEADGFNCKCNNQFKRDSKWTISEGQSPPPCELCLRPRPGVGGVNTDSTPIVCANLPEGIEKPVEMTVVASGFSGKALTRADLSGVCVASASWWLTESHISGVTADVNGTTVQTFGNPGSNPCSVGDCVWRGERDVGVWVDFFNISNILKVAFRTCLHSVDANTLRYTTQMCVPQWPASSPCIQQGFSMAASYFATYTKDVDITGMSDSEILETLFWNIHTLTRSTTAGWQDASCTTFNTDCPNSIGYPCTAVLPATITLIPGPAGALEQGQATDDGSCGSNCPANLTPVADPGAGACCIDGICNTFMTQAECEDPDVNGEWFDSDFACESCEGSDQDMGSCCACLRQGFGAGDPGARVGEIACTQVTRAWCKGVSGTFNHGGTCTGEDCNQCLGEPCNINEPIPANCGSESSASSISSASSASSASSSSSSVNVLGCCVSIVSAPCSNKTEAACLAEPLSSWDGTKLCDGSSCV